jgi:hypothetical protein
MGKHMADVILEAETGPLRDIEAAGNLILAFQLPEL